MMSTHVLDPVVLSGPGAKVTHLDYNTPANNFAHVANYTLCGTGSSGKKYSQHPEENPR